MCLVVHKSGPNCYLELNVDIEECHILVCKDELRFDNGLVVVRPGSVIKRVTLQCLPWLRPQRLLEGLRGTLGNYGGVRYVGIATDSDTGAFFGSGYTILDCSPSPNQTDPFLGNQLMLSNGLILQAAEVCLLFLFISTGKTCPPIVSITMNSAIAQSNVKRYPVISVLAFIALNLTISELNTLINLF